MRMKTALLQLKCVSFRLISPTCGHTLWEWEAAAGEHVMVAAT